MTWGRQQSEDNTYVVMGDLNFLQILAEVLSL